MNIEYYLSIFIVFAICFIWLFNLNPIALSQVPSNNGAFQRSKLAGFEEALKYYDKALAINPNAMDILTNKGMVLIKLGKYNEAITIFNKILSNEPKNVAGLYNKGVAFDKLGNHLEAKQYIQEALQINPKYVSDFINRLTAANSVAHLAGRSVTK